VYRDIRPRTSRAAQTAGACLVWLSGAIASPALAYLGGDVNSVGADQAVLHGQLTAASMLQYDVNQITLPSGTVVSEYTSASRRVFAITWQGPTPPDLRTLFGAYFGSYQNAATSGTTARAGAHRALRLTQTDFIVETAGRPRAFRGRAYVPSLVPSGVAVTELP
jgi:hypothetical protein